MALLELENNNDKCQGETPKKRGKKSSSGRQSPPKNPDSQQQQQSQSHGKKNKRLRTREFRSRNKKSSSSSYNKKHNTPHAKSSGGPTSKVPHDLPMGKKDLYFALDCEMVGVGPHGVDSALARVSIVNYDAEVVLDTFVKVPVPVTDYRTYVSGIRPEDVESAEARSLDDTRERVQNILRGKILIGHGLANDMKALMMTHPWCDTRDTTTYEPFMRKQESSVDDNNKTRSRYFPRRLRDLSIEILGQEIQVPGRPHSPVEDALAALNLYKAVRPEWEKRMSAQVKHANDLEEQAKGAAPSHTKSFTLLPTFPRVRGGNRVAAVVSPPHSPTPSRRVHKQRQAHKQQSPPHYLNPMAMNPNNFVYGADGRMYFVPPQNYHQQPHHINHKAAAA
jgi:RNA exonuclease 4